MHTYKLICSDIDGTLLNAHREVSPQTIQVVKKINQQLPFVLISARMPNAMRHIQMALGVEQLPMVCYNGGLVLHQNTVLDSTTIPHAVSKKIANLVLEKNLHFGMYHNDEWYVSKLDEWAQREENNTKVTPVLKSPDEVFEAWQTENKQAHKLMCIGDENLVDQVFKALSETFSEELHLYRSKPTYIEIAPKAISKLTGIKIIAEQVYQVQPHQIVAYGDNYNDVELLAGVGLGVAVANAVAPVKTVADAHTLAGKEDGVAHHLAELFQL